MRINATYCILILLRVGDTNPKNEIEKVCSSDKNLCNNLLI